MTTEQNNDYQRSVYLIYDLKPSKDFTDCAFDPEKDKVVSFDSTTPARVIMEMAQENDNIDSVMLFIQKGMFGTNVLTDIITPATQEEQKYTVLMACGNEHPIIYEILIYDRDGIKKAFEYNKRVYQPKARFGEQNNGEDDDF